MGPALQSHRPFGKAGRFPLDAGGADEALSADPGRKEAGNPDPGDEAAGDAVENHCEHMNGLLRRLEAVIPLRCAPGPVPGESTT
jgi:hypothetical protein